MKLKNHIPALLILVALTFALPIDSLAQHHRHVVRHSWYTAHHCRVETRHIYFPMHNFYFDVHRNMYVYLSGNNWVFSVNLPVWLARVDLRYEPIVELDYYMDDPYFYNSYHIVTYKDYHKHYGRRSYREYGHNHSYYNHHGHNHHKGSYGDNHNTNRYNSHKQGNYKNHDYDRNDSRGRYDHRNGYGNGNGRESGREYYKDGNKRGNNIHKETKSVKQYDNSRNSKNFSPRDPGRKSGNGRQVNGRSASVTHRM